MPQHAYMLREAASEDATPLQAYRLGTEETCLGRKRSYRSSLDSRTQDLQINVQLAFHGQELCKARRHEPESP